MVKNPKVTLIGAGGMSFGPIMCNDAVNSDVMRDGGTLMLHDINEERLDVTYGAAKRLNEKHGNAIRIEKSTDAEEAMSGADFCLMSTELRRFPFWEMDYEVPLKYGATHIMGENGGPGAVFHSLRSIKTCIGICRDIEKYCPDTFLINLTNPMSRVTLAINRGTKIRNVGLCHEFAGGITRMGLYLLMSPKKIAAKASGINHFTFFYEIKNADTGEDLYPKLRKVFESPIFNYPKAVTDIAKLLFHIPIVDFGVEQMYSPLVSHMFREYGMMPASVDSHIGEYVPFAQEITKAWHVVPYAYHGKICENVDKLMTDYGSGKSLIPFHLMSRSQEEGFKVIDGLASGERTYLNAINVPNKGYIPNLPDDAIVEVPAWTGDGQLEPETVPPVHQPLADFMDTQIKIQDLVVKAALDGDPKPALDALIMDPLSPKDEGQCRAMFDEMMKGQAGHLPF